jgi:NAD-dependent SIR2 family protein deacetylase
MEAFTRSPGLVWEFYEYRRSKAAAALPNPGHFAIAALQKQFAASGRTLTVITQNIDRLHQLSGASDVIEMHGSLWCVKVRIADTTSRRQSLPQCVPLPPHVPSLPHDPCGPPLAVFPRLHTHNC